MAMLGRSAKNNTDNEMKPLIKKIAKTYAIITVIMVINLAIFYFIAEYYFSKQKQEVGYNELHYAQGDNLTKDENFSRLGQQVLEGKHANLRHLIETCGVPDGYQGDIHGELELIYLYNRFAEKDWVAYISIKNGFVTGIGYNDSSVNSHDQYKPWDISMKDIPSYK